MTQELVIAVGSDHAGYRHKELLRAELDRRGYRVIDVGTESGEPCDYPDFAVKVAELVSSGEADRGILICGTGAGMAMAANKVPGIRAAACNKAYTAEYTRLHNDLNVLAVGARVIDAEKALGIAEMFLATEYEGAKESGRRHARRLGKIADLEARYMSGTGLER